MKSSALEKIKNYTGKIMDKKRLRIALKVLEAVKTKYFLLIRLIGKNSFAKVMVMEYFCNP